MVKGLVGFAGAVVVLRQRNACHVVVRIQAQQVLVLFKGLVVLAQFIVQAGQHRPEFNMVRFGGNGIFQEGLRLLQLSCTGQHVELVHHQLVAATDALFQIAIDLARVGHVAIACERIGQVEVHLVMVGPLVQDAAIDSGGLAGPLVLKAEVGQQQTVPDVLLVGCLCLARHIDGGRGVLAGVVELAELVHRSRVLGIHAQAGLEQLRRLGQVTRETRACGVHEHRHHLRALVLGGGFAWFAPGSRMRAFGHATCATACSEHNDQEQGGGKAQHFRSVRQQWRRRRCSGP